MQNLNHLNSNISEPEEETYGQNERLRSIFKKDSDLCIGIGGNSVENYDKKMLRSTTIPSVIKLAANTKSLFRQKKQTSAFREILRQKKKEGIVIRAHNYQNDQYPSPVPSLRLMKPLAKSTLKP